MLTNRILVRKPARYAVAVALPIATVALRVTLEPALGWSNPLTLLYPVVLVVAAIAGLGPALVTIAVATIASFYVLVQPVGTLQASPGDALGLALFVVVCVVIALLTVRFKDARIRAEESATRAESSAALAQESADRAERLLRLREGFSAMLAHEIRTPVTIILGNAKLLRRPTLDAEQRDGIAADIDAEAERLHRLIEDLLVLNRGDERLELLLEPVIVAPLIAQVARTATAGARVTVSVESGLPLVQAEPTYLEQLLRNLVSNARKYGGEGPIEIVARRSGDGVLIAVSDHGPGIDEADRERVFDAFYRSDTARRSGAPGAGVGLFVCRRLAEAMGGSIRAESNPAGGTSMVIELRPFTQADDTSGVVSTGPGV